ncbi:MAG: ABC transporter permease subunit [Granulosicoccus sp.]
MNWQRAFALLIVALFVVPLLFGLAGTLLNAAGFFSLASTGGSGNGFNVVLSDPRFVPSIWLTLKTGIVATLLVLLLTVVTLVSAHDTRLWRWIKASMPPLLAVPHAAIAVGLVYLIAPSGWLVRLVSPAISGWQRPPTTWVVPDADGWSLILGLLIKETPFLLLAATAQLTTLNIDASLHIGRTLGYSPARCWSRLILPQLYPRIRLTLFIILAFNLSVVDMAILLGPGTPPTFSVLLLSLVNDPGSRSAASAGALLLGVLVLLVFAVVAAVEYAVARITRYRRQSGARGHGFGSWRRMGQLMCLLLLASSALSLLMLVTWSVTRRWRFPDILPGAWSLEQWVGRAGHMLQPALTTLSLAVFTAVLAVLTAITWLELERLGHVRRLDWLWYVPLLIPQVSLLFGWQAAALLTETDGAWLTVAHAHWLYALPYVVLILAVAWRDLDPYWNHAAATLGAGYWRILWKVRLPLMLLPLSQAAAVAVAVSVAQYLPTLLLGAGRHQTLAIELVTSFGGVDRRVIASLAVLQSVLPLLAFIAALTVPRWNRLRLQKDKLNINSYAGPN